MQSQDVNWDYDDVERELRKELHRSGASKKRRRLKRNIKEINKAGMSRFSMRRK